MIPNVHFIIITLHYHWEIKKGRKKISWIFYTMRLLVIIIFLLALCHFLLLLCMTPSIKWTSSYWPFSSYKSFILEITPLWFVSSVFLSECNALFKRRCSCFLLNQLVEIEDFPVDVPKMHSLREIYMKDRVPTALWLL